MVDPACGCQAALEAGTECDCALQASCYCDVNCACPNDVCKNADR